MADAMASLREEIEVVLSGEGVPGFEGMSATLQLIPCRWCSQKGEFRFLDKDEVTGKRTQRSELCPQCNGWKKIYRVSPLVTSWHGAGR